MLTHLRYATFDLLYLHGSYLKVLYLTVEPPLATHVMVTWRNYPTETWPFEHNSLPRARMIGMRANIGHHASEHENSHQATASSAR